jgi:hypothetical protein
MEATAHRAEILRVRKASDYYAVLDVARGADTEAVKRAYKQHALLLHPDRNDQPGAEDAFKKLLEAYVVLTDGKHRSAYDAKRSADDLPKADKRSRPKKAAPSTPPTSEEVAARKELDEMLQRAYKEEHSAWVQKARHEQSFVLLAVGGMLLSFVLGTFGYLLFMVWPNEDELASGPQALQRSWGAQLSASTSWFVSLVGRFLWAVLALVLLIVGGPTAFGLFVWCTGKACEWLFDALAILGNTLGPRIEAYVSSLPARQRNGAGGRRKRR